MNASILLAALLPAWEMRVVERVAADFSLTREGRAFLVAVRRAENGTPPYYYGVAYSRADTYEKQCRWTANTIRKRYDGDVEKFAARWCPHNWRVWARNVRWFMRKQGVEK